MASDIDLESFFPNISNPRSRQPDHSTCDATSLQWAGLILTVFSISVSWWLLELPLLWKRRPASPDCSAPGLGLRVHRFMDSVSWQCLRAHMPCVAAILAMQMTGDPREIALIYYRGPLHPLPEVVAAGGGRSPRLSRLQIAVAVAVDIATIAGTAATIANAIIDDGRGADGAASRPSAIFSFDSSGWLSPALPIAICGLWLLACSATAWSRRWILLAGFVLIVLAGCAIILPLALLDRNVYVYPDGREYHSGPEVPFLTLMSYIFTAFPVAFVYPPLTPIVLLSCAFGRNGALAITSLGSSPSFPFCPLRRGKAFGITFLVFGVAAMVLARRGFAIYFGRPLPDSRRCWGWYGPAPRDGEEADPDQRWARIQVERVLEEADRALRQYRLPPGSIELSSLPPSFQR